MIHIDKKGADERTHKSGMKKKKKKKIKGWANLDATVSSSSNESREPIQEK
jgi:hypothetical protein